MSEVHSALVPIAVPQAPPPRGLGLRTKLTLWLGLCAMTPTVVLGAALWRQQIHGRSAAHHEELTRAALLLRELLLTGPPPSCAALSAAQEPRLAALGRATGYDLALYSGARRLAATNRRLLPVLDGNLVLRALEGGGSEAGDALVRLPLLDQPRHPWPVGFAGVLVRLPPSLPSGECGRLLLLLAAAPPPTAAAGGAALLVAALAILLGPLLILLPARLSGPMTRLRERIQAMVSYHRSERSFPGQGAGAPALDDVSRLLPLDDALWGRGDELGDLARACAQMTETMREKEDRLGARVRELTTLHAIGRAISSVLDLEEALQKIVSEVVAIFSARRGALVLLGPDMRPRLGAGIRIEPAAASAVAALGEALIRRGGMVRIDDLARDPELSAPARHGGLSGSLMAVPLEGQQGRVLGVLLISRSRGRARFTDADLQLLATVADQAATAISNARLYDEVQRSSEDLELRVKERTFDLVMANQELARVVENLHQAQAQLVLSERLAGLGQLVAGVAHEINSPAGAIKGAADALQDNVVRMAERARQLADLGLPEQARTRFLTLCDEVAPGLPAGPLRAPTQVRRRSRDFAAELARHLPGVSPEDLLDSGRTLVELGLLPGPGPRPGPGNEPTLEVLAGAALAATGRPAKESLGVLVGYLQERAYLHRNAHAIKTAIGQITRIVGALKSYSHLDQARVDLTDIHEGLETTLVILHSELKYGIILTRKYGTVPAIPAYVDELNQVWTNLLHNAVQALQQQQDQDRSKEILIETGTTETPPRAPQRESESMGLSPGGGTLPPSLSEDEEGTRLVCPGLSAQGCAGGAVWVAIEDNGPGIPQKVLPRIFEPFFTTKQKGEGTGMGLGIVRQIVSKHHGWIDVLTRPGRTRFTVWLPVRGPAQARG